MHYLQECIEFEIKIKGKLCNFISLYSSPNHGQDDLSQLYMRQFKKKTLLRSDDGTENFASFSK